jgi:hypothetical protein
MFVENRSFTEPRHSLIASSPALQERATAKSRALIASVALALGERGINQTQANLAAQIGMAIISHGVQAWFTNGSIDLEEHIVRAVKDAHHLFSNRVETVNARQKRLTARQS